MQHIVIVGGGAAGLVAAIYAKTKNNQVTILERNSSCGKKILATGNGKCNYWNTDQSLIHYHSINEEYLKDIITEQNKKEILDFFDSLGIYPKIKNGYYYPFSNQATTIKNALISEIKKKNIAIKNDFLVEKIEKEHDQFKIYSNKEFITADKLIVATGSKASPKTGSDGIGYKLLRKMSHTIIEPKPALVQIETSGDFLKKWAGIRTDVEISLYEDDKLIKKELGEIQLTDYGVSGICVFNISRYIPIGLSHNKKEIIKINFLPFLKSPTTEELQHIFKTNRAIKEQLEGVLNNKLVEILLTKSNINTYKPYQQLSEKEQQSLLKILTAFKLDVIGTKSFDNAQVCSGGVPLNEVCFSTMESHKIKDLYIVGELLDVDGDCGGYNLSFAWISGMLAGKGCASND